VSTQYSRSFSASPETIIDHNDEQRLPVTMFSEDEEMVRDAARQWANDVLKPVVREMDDESKTHEHIIRGLFENGFMGMEIPEEFGGSAMNFTSAILVVEELSRVDPSVSIMADIHNTLTNNAVRFWGSDTLKEKWLPRLATDCVSSFALSEAGSGTDAFAMKTTATPSTDGSYYTLNGEKLWISNSREAGVFLVFANANPSLKHKGITAFMVDANTEGVHVGKPEKKLGLRASSTCPVVFDNVKVDADDVLGEVGLGYKYCINILNEGRIGIASQQIGIAKGCFDVAMPYLNDRKQFGTKLADFQGMEHQYAQIATEIHAAEVMTYNACRMKENGLPFVKEASMVKLFASQVAEKAASKSIEWLGGVGFTQDLLAEKFFRDCKVGSIYEGASNILLQTIAKRIKEEYH
jgi:short/branched chain acyl-CoA dehydrogenase